VLGRLSPFGEASEDALLKAAARDLVHLPSVRAAAAAWAAYITDNPPIDYTDSLYSRASFLRAFKDIGDAPLTAADVDVLLRWLERDAGRVVVDGDVSSYKRRS
jgi:charged multivesicular body protein 7